ncbi:hypothetical protein PV04_02657 [Phialophora macrospora]|uniref:DUF1223 domain-containing protein n=1 Tax=Phialophora macrospora TaxID=1851006 RepID=A0A0D2GE12_9EURO|nr:hypothetical protein PV04_02657 [Phialophora macrospora]
MAHNLTKEMKSIFKSLRPASRSSTPEQLHRHDRTLHDAEIADDSMAAPSPQSQSPTSPERPPVLIELFQSQGCNSCPPTNDNLISFIQTHQSSTSLSASSPPRFYANHSSSLNPTTSASTSPAVPGPEYLLLTYQVTYWDYLGWNDTFGLPVNDIRQREYVRHMGLRAAYTPMVVVNGRGVGVGNTKNDLEKIVREGEQVQARVRMEKVATPSEVDDIQFEIDATSLAPSGTYSPHSSNSQFEIWEIAYTAMAQDVHISRGENAGRTLPHLNVVKDVKRIGYLARGGQGRFRVEGQGDGKRRSSQPEGRVVIVQNGKGGEVVGVLMI